MFNQFSHLKIKNYDLFFISLYIIYLTSTTIMNLSLTFD